MTDVSSLTEALNGVEADKAPTEEELRYLDKLVGEGKKYSDPEQLAKAYLHANTHLDELRAKLDERNTQEVLLKEVLDELHNSRSNNGVTEEAPPNKGTEAQSINREDVRKLVDNELKTIKTQEKRRDNVMKSFEMLREAYGSDYDAKSAFVKTHNNNADLIRLLDDLAATDPDALLRFVQGTVPVTRKEGGAVNTPGMEKMGSAHAKIPTTDGFNAEYVRKIRKEDPKLYKSQEFQTRLHKAVAAALEGGKDFFAT